MPADRPRPPVMSLSRHQGAVPDSERADERCGSCAAGTDEPVHVFAAGLNTLLYRYTGQDDILVGIPIADRERPELQELIGFLLDTHVLADSTSAATRRSGS